MCLQASEITDAVIVILHKEPCIYCGYRALAFPMAQYMTLYFCVKIIHPIEHNITLMPLPLTFSFHLHHCHCQTRLTLLLLTVVYWWKAHCCNNAVCWAAASVIQFLTMEPVQRLVYPLLNELFIAISVCCFCNDCDRLGFTGVEKGYIIISTCAFYEQTLPTLYVSFAFLQWYKGRGSLSWLL
jgi:hypothetical protein